MQSLYQTKYIKFKLLLVAMIFGGIVAIGNYFIQLQAFQKNTISFAITNGHKKIEERSERINEYFRSLQTKTQVLFFGLELDEKSIDDVLKQKQTIEKKLLLQTTSHPEIYQIKILDSRGFEKINITRKQLGNDAKIVPDNELQDKSGRDYFKQASQSPLEKLLLSKIDLNVENGKVEIPYKPMIRAMIPFGKGQFEGVLVVNYFAQPFLEKIANMPLYDAMMTNEKGEFLYHYHKELAWSHYGNKPFLLKDQFPTYAKGILSSTKLQTESFISKKIDYGAGYSFVLVMQISHEYLDEMMEKEKKDQLKTGIAFFLLPVAFALFLLKYLNILLKEQNNTLLELEKKQRELEFAYEIESKNKLLETQQVELNSLLNHHRILFENAPVAYMIVDEKWKIIEANKIATKRFISFKSSQTPSILALMSSVDKQNFINHIEYSSLFATDLVIKLKSGKEYAKNKIYAYPLPDQKGHYMVSAVDVESEYQLFDQMEKANQLDKKLQQQSKMVAMGEMIGNIAHQWKQPLHIMLNHITLVSLKIKKNKITLESIPEELDKLLPQINYLSDTITVFKDYFKEDQEKIEVVLQERIDFALDLIKDTLSKEDITLIKHIDYDHEIHYSLVKGHLIEVLINLINNAKDILVEREIEDKKIEIYLQKTHKNIFITIADNGGGIPEQIIGKIFDPYFTTKHNSRGTGLGLHIVYKIVTESLGGFITASNDQAGAKFEIKLPLERHDLGFTQSIMGTHLI